MNSKNDNNQNVLISAMLFVVEVIGYVLIVYFDFIKAIIKGLNKVVKTVANILIIMPYRTIKSIRPKKLPKITLPHIEIPPMPKTQFRLPKFEHRKDLSESRVLEKKREIPLETKKIIIQTADTHLKKRQSIFKRILYIIFFPLIAFYKTYKFITNIQLKIKPFSCLSVFILIVLTLGYISSVFYFSILDELPDVNTLKKFDPKQTTNIYDRKGNLLYRTYNNEDRYYIPLSEIPQVVINATLAVEDASF